MILASARGFGAAPSIRAPTSMLARLSPVLQAQAISPRVTAQALALEPAPEQRRPGSAPPRGGSSSPGSGAAPEPPPVSGPVAQESGLIIPPPPAPGLPSWVAPAAAFAGIVGLALVAKRMTKGRR